MEVSRLPISSESFMLKRILDMQKMQMDQIVNQPAAQLNAQQVMQDQGVVNPPNLGQNIDIRI